MKFRRSLNTPPVASEPVVPKFARGHVGKRLFFVGLGFTWTLIAPAAWNVASAQPEAQPAPHTTVVDTTADRYFFEAKAKAAQKQWVEALVLFEKAWEIKPSHDIAGNLGQVALKLGRYKKAAVFLERCLRLFPPTGNPEQRTQIQTLFQSALGHVAQVQIHVKAQTGELLLDRANVIGPAASITEPVFVDPGTHILQVRRDGQVVAETSFLAVANASQDVTLAVDKPTDTGVSTSSATHPKGSHSSRAPHEEKGSGHASATSHDGFLHGRSAWPVVIGATVSVASFVSAGFLVVAANSQASEADDIKRNRLGNAPANYCMLNAGKPDCQNLHAANERADSRYNWGHAMIGIGGASLLATAVYVIWPHSSDKGAASSQTFRTPSVSFDIRPGVSTFNCQFRF